MIKCFVINLKRRKDRLKKISSHLDSNGLKFIKFEAIDAEKSSYSLLNKNIAQGGGPLGNIPKGDLACFQSHYSLWMHVANNENNPVLILEDDCIPRKELSSPGNDPKPCKVEVIGKPVA
mgnify:CR=1 FL=1